MYVDWAVELGADDPVLDFPWASQDGLRYYDLKSDPNELTNTASTLTAAQVKSLQGTLTAIQNCHGAAQCWKAEHR